MEYIIGAIIGIVIWQTLSYIVLSASDKNAKFFVKKVKNGKTLKSFPPENKVYKGEDQFCGWDMAKFRAI